MAYIKIDKNAFFYNLNQICKIVPKRKIAIVLKDNAYGHGIKEIAQFCQEFGIKNAIVKDLQEAFLIEHFFNNILILNSSPQTKYHKKFQFCINSLKDFHHFAAHNVVHIKVDTGMHRNGIHHKELEKAFLLAKKKNLFIKGVFSHNAAADIISSQAFWQYKNFLQIIQKTKKLSKKLKLDIPKFHFANSSTLFRFKKDAVFDMVRVGIAAYGYIGLEKFFNPPSLKPVLSLHAKKISTRFLYKETKIGYDGSGVVKKKGYYSTYDVGYGDGFFRFDAKNGFKIGENKKIIGKISMDNMSISGKSKDICLIKNANFWAKKFNTIPYEILVKLDAALPKIVE